MWVLHTVPHAAWNAARDLLYMCRAVSHAQALMHRPAGCPSGSISLYRETAQVYRAQSPARGDASPRGMRPDRFRTR